jgi:hypothetical protein
MIRRRFPISVMTAAATFSQDKEALQQRIGETKKTHPHQPKDTVTFNARFSNLADGTNFLEESVLDASAEENQIKTTNSGHHKTGR